MTISEFSVQFDVLYNNTTSNQSPGLNEFEKSLFITKAEKEIVKNYFTANSKGNNLGQGFDGSLKRQADFSVLTKTSTCTKVESDIPSRIDSRSTVYEYPNDVFIVLNESVKMSGKYSVIKQVVPLRYDEYTRLMLKPYKRPLKNQVWKLTNSAVAADDSGNDKSTSTKYVELITDRCDDIDTYSVRYIRTPEPIILETLTGGLSIDGKTEKSEKCELDPILHEDVLQRAVELAKMTWASTGQDNTQMALAMGQRSE